MKKGTENSWEIDGDCSKCRRNDYCIKPCKKANIASRMAMMEAFRGTKVGRMMTMMKHMMEDR